MRYKNMLAAFMMMTMVTLSGCAVFDKTTESVEVHDDVLVYNLPYDLTYLRTMEAVSFLPNWELLETEKEKGLIRLNNTNFRSLSDADNRSATIFVRRVNREQTSVELASFSQRVLGGDKLLAAVDDLISREL